ncbi:hypothetical protein J4455_03615 [Candidatus Woesearchaeota archaeon]|nr:hypothetical protein [Candidatus Woesearchaeota archaeon]
MEDIRTRALSCVERFGPLIPIQISKELSTNLIFAGAILSELVSRKSILITNVKKGGSPFYYVRGQEEKLQNLSINLGAREKEIYNSIKDNLVLMDNDLEPWQRVAIREIKDYAVKIDYSLNEINYVFWRWYLLNEQNAIELIKEGLPLEVEPKVENKEEILNEVLVNDDKEKIVEEVKIEEPKIEEVVEEKIEENLNQKILNYFKDSNIKLLGSHIVRKNSETNYEIEISSDIGALKYLAKLKIKKLINDKDLNNALNEGINLGMPVILFSNGMLNKKGREFLAKKSTYIMFKQF